MATITTTEYANAIPTIVAANALGYLKSNTVFAQLINRDFDNEVASYGQTIDVTIIPDLDVNDKGENDVVTLQNPTVGKTSVTLDNHKEVSFLIEDFAKALARPDYLSGLMETGMAKLAETMDASIAALYAGFSQTIDATAGLAETHFRQSRKMLNTARVPLAGRWAVLHEDAEYELLGIEKFVNRDYAELQGAPQGLLNAYSGRFMGFNVYMDQNIVTVAGGLDPDEHKNLFGHRNSAVLVTRPLAAAPAGMGAVQTVMNEGGIGVRVTMSYDTDYLGVKTTLDVLWGVAELRDNHAVVVTTEEVEIA